MNQYNTPEMEIMFLKEIDVITSSGDGEFGDDETGAW